jgi:uncharacterized protein with PIN domain
VSRALVPFGEVEARADADVFRRYGKGRHAAGLNFGNGMAYAVAQAEGRSCSSPVTTSRRPT